jgi:hypothetical protein
VRLEGLKSKVKLTIVSVTGNTMNEFINENWRLVVEELGKPVFTSLGSIVHTNLLNVAQKVPYNEMFAE